MCEPACVSRRDLLSRGRRRDRLRLALRRDRLKHHLRKVDRLRGCLDLRVILSIVVVSILARDCLLKLSWKPSDRLSGDIHRLSSRRRLDGRVGDTHALLLGLVQRGDVVIHGNAKPLVGSRLFVDPSLKEWRDAGRERMEGPPPCSLAAPPGRTRGAQPRHPSRVVASEGPSPLSLAPAGFRLAAPEELRLGTHLV